MRLILASNNAKKLRELQQLFEGLPIELVTQGSLGIPEADEPHHSFVENALAKARQAAKLGGGAAIADDSGLCVDALGGAPGVVSAHYADVTFPPDLPREERRAQHDQANNAKLRQVLEGVADRRAHFISLLVAIRHADDPEPLIACGRWSGEVLADHRGAGGFGYDPLLYIPELGASVAELGADVKNRCSHRALAAAQMREQMREVWHLG